MNKRLLVMLILVLAVMCFALAATAATPPSADRSVGPRAEPTVPAPADHLAVTLGQGPDPFCPGWNLYYTLAMTNTSSTEALTGVVVSDRVPAGTWAYPPDLGGTIPGIYDDQQGVISWNVGQINPGQSVSIQLLLHSFSSLPQGIVVSNTLTYSATQLSELGQVTDGATVDSEICGVTKTPSPTYTPTSTPTLTPTPTLPRPAGWALLPLVIR